MKPTMKHIQYARDDIQALSRNMRLKFEELTKRVQALETSLSKSSKK